MKNYGKHQTLTMMQLDAAHLDTRKILVCNNFYIRHDNFETKCWQDVLNFTTKDSLIHWLFSYD